MNLISLRALTWGTVAAAVISALLLAAAETGMIDFGHESASEGLLESAMPADPSGAGSHRKLPSTSPRHSAPGRDAPQR